MRIIKVNGPMHTNHPTHIKNYLKVKTMLAALREHYEANKCETPSHWAIEKTAFSIKCCIFIYTPRFYKTII